MIQLFELAGSDPKRTFSPYCWRIRMALAHKGLEVESVPWRFKDAALIAPSGQARVPVLVHEGKWLHESWDIACYLEDTFSDRPSLFGGAAGRSLSRFYTHYGEALSASLARFCMRDILDHLDSVDAAYFRESREKRFGVTLEAFVADRDQRLATFRESLAPLRSTLKAQPFLGGAQAMYADYSVFCHFQWARAVSPYQLLEPDDPVAQWRDRLLDAFGGLARSSPGNDR